MATIRWCKNQNRGIRLIEPNDNLFREYIETAEETLDVLKSIKGKSKVWLATTKYYCEYFAIYSLLMKIGIIGCQKCRPKRLGFKPHTKMFGDIFVHKMRDT